jgi:hypothetical protein
MLMGTLVLTALQPLPDALATRRPPIPALVVQRSTAAAPQPAPAVAPVDPAAINALLRQHKQQARTIAPVDPAAIDALLRQHEQQARTVTPVDPAVIDALLRQTTPRR